MKKSTIIVLFSLQILILVGVISTAYFTFMNKARIRATQRVMVDTQEKLGSTFSFMDKIDQAKKKEEKAKEPLMIGSEAPTFTLENEKKQEVTLADYKGKKTLLVFSQESCGYCQKFYPILNEFQGQREDINVVIMQVGSTPDQNNKYKKEQGITAPLLAATYQELQAYKVQHTPTSVFLNEESKIIATRTVNDLAGLTSLVEESLAVSSDQKDEKGAKNG